MNEKNTKRYCVELLIPVATPYCVADYDEEAHFFDTWTEAEDFMTEKRKEGWKTSKVMDLFELPF